MPRIGGKEKRRIDTQNDEKEDETVTEKDAHGQPSWHALEANGVQQTLGVDSSTGLSEEEVHARREKYGSNTLPDAAKRSFWAVILSQFQSPLIYLLFLASIAAYFLGHAGDALVILCVVLLNALIGSVQEGRAERSMKALQKLSELRVRVRRNGSEQSVDSRDLVPGDIVMLAAGDSIAADARLFDTASLEVAEAALTGESNPVSKAADALPPETLLAERRNMVYSGTHVTAGRGIAWVTEIGERTEIGKISQLTQSAAEPKTPLEIRIQQFGRYLVGAALAVFALVVTVGVLRGLPFFEIIMIAISQMVSMVPEGLPVAMTIALAIGMQRMAAKRVVVRRLAAVETLGSTEIICTDKTGTLTRNEMTVTTLWLGNGRQVGVSGVGYRPEGQFLCDDQPLRDPDRESVRRILEAAVLCNDAEVRAPEGEETGWQILGDPTEAAMVTAAMKFGIEPHELRDRFPRIAEIPFDSDSKMMATQHGRGDRRWVCLKGAPEAILPLCIGEAFSDGVRPDQTEAGIEAARRAVDAFAERALRVIAVGEVVTEGFDPEGGFEPFRGKVRLLGLIGQIDPPREEAIGAIQSCRRAGIRPVMVTGDHQATGLAIARKVGIANPNDIAVNGLELEGMTDAQLRERLDRIAVFARVYPAQKLRIVHAFQSAKRVVGMTGDGVNDAPALAAADVGVAMGITGTEVAKGASEIVITDDKFSTIVEGVEEGRLVYRNLKKVILYLFATSMAEVLVLLSALFLGMPLPLAAVQILWINIVTEGTVTVNLIMDPLEGDEMRTPPIPKSEPLLDRQLLGRVALMTPVMALSTLAYFGYSLSIGLPIELARTETFTVLAACQWFNVLNCRSRQRSAFSVDVFRNPWLIGGLVVGVVLQFAVIYNEGLNRVFRTVPIPVSHLFPIALAASTVLWAEEARKLWVRWASRRPVGSADVSV